MVIYTRFEVATRLKEISEETDEYTESAFEFWVLVMSLMTKLNTDKLSIRVVGELNGQYEAEVQIFYKNKQVHTAELSEYLPEKLDIANFSTLAC